MIADDIQNEMMGPRTVLWARHMRAGSLWVVRSETSDTTTSRFERESSTRHPKGCEGDGRGDSKSFSGVWGRMAWGWNPKVADVGRHDGDTGRGGIADGRKGDTGTSSIRPRVGLDNLISSFGGLWFERWKESTARKGSTEKPR